MSTPTSLSDQLVAISTTRQRAAVDPTELRSLVATCTPQRARDAYLRYTASNRPIPSRPHSHPAGAFWGWCLRHEVLSMVIALSGWCYVWVITDSVVLGGLIAAMLVGGTVTVQTRPRKVPAPAVGVAANPWPIGAERVPGYGRLVGESTVLRPEAELLGIAVLLVETIKATPVATSNIIVAGNLLDQVDQSLQSISQQCHRIWQIRSSLKAPESHSDVGAALQSAIDQRIGLVQRNWRDLLDNVAQLTELAVNADSYAKILRDFTRHQRLVAENPGYPSPMMPHPQWMQLQEMQVNLAAQVEFIKDTAWRVSNVHFG